MSYFTLRWSTIFHNWKSIYSSEHPDSIMNWVRNHVPPCFHTSTLFPPSFSHNLLCPFYTKFCPLVNGSLNYFLQLVLSSLQLYPSETRLCAHQAFRRVFRHISAVVQYSCSHLGWSGPTSLVCSCFFLFSSLFRYREVCSNFFESFVGHMWYHCRHRLRLLFVSLFFLLFLFFIISILYLVGWPSEQDAGPLIFPKNAIAAW